jgi:hypothetical protein
MEIPGPWTKYPEMFFVTLSQAPKQTPGQRFKLRYDLSFHSGHFKINTTLYVLSTESVVK